MKIRNKNKKLAIIVGTLLFFCEVSLAYFTSNILSSGNGSSTEVSTATIKGATLNVIGNIEFNDLDMLPGHTNISSVKITATGKNELIPYNLIWKGTNTLNTPLNFKVYKTSSSIEVSSSCEKKVSVENGAQILKEVCTISNLDKLGEVIYSGDIPTSTTESKIILAKDEFITATSDGMSVYYYVVLEYPNLDEPQNIDMGGTFNGNINVEESDTTPDINILAAYIEQEDGTYKESKDIPQEGYIVDTEKSSCNNNATPTGITPNITINNLSKSGTSCYLYFEKYIIPFAGDTILAEKTISERTDFSMPLTLDTTGIIYTAEDDNGTSYYFAGNPADNWVKFAGFYWRIIRINGDNTIRLIYNGITTATSGTNLQITKSAFNSIDNDNMYVGYMYTSGQVHGLGSSSTIKGVLESWYKTNIIDKGYENKIDENNGFCGDRSITTGTGIGTNYSEYGGYSRLYINNKPTFKCADKSDLYTKINTLNGNKTLTYPIGLISADEVIYAGGKTNATNLGYYLTTNEYYWTMSPCYFKNDGQAGIFSVYGTGDIGWSNVINLNGARPVINLKADTIFKEGTNGTIANPYIVVGSE